MEKRRERVRARFLNLIMLASAFAVLMAATPASASVIYSTFGPNDDFDKVTGWAIGQFPIDRNLAHGFKFNTASTQAYLDSVDLALFHVAGPRAVSVNLSTDNGFQPGDVLERVTIDAPVASSIVTVNFSGTTLLDPSTNYWLWLAAENPVARINWRRNDIDRKGLRASSADGGETWQVDLLAADEPAFRVSASAVPVPGTLLLLGSGLASLFSFRRRPKEG